MFVSISTYRGGAHKNYAASQTKPYTFTSGEVISSSQVNENFDKLFEVAGRKNGSTVRFGDAVDVAALSINGVGVSTSLQVTWCGGTISGTISANVGNSNWAGGALSIANGGTGQTTEDAALNALGNGNLVVDLGLTNGNRVKWGNTDNRSLFCSSSQCQLNSEGHIDVKTDSANIASGGYFRVINGGDDQ